ncbi:hypothetical protein [uncultured Brevibacillus sp.]|uniref:hypothetical protein n=1 Tax=uncultured Brevibacillus sp. TaxID=169970 RepID=UPI002593DE5B|nr:hypothetical protein [uncultured Brevibacillus sp.]
MDVLILTGDLFSQLGDVGDDINFTGMPHWDYDDNTYRSFIRAAFSSVKLTEKNKIEFQFTSAAADELENHPEFDMVDGIKDFFRLDAGFFIDRNGQPIGKAFNVKIDVK